MLYMAVVISGFSFVMLVQSIFKTAIARLWKRRNDLLRMEFQCVKMNGLHRTVSSETTGRASWCSFRGNRSMEKIMMTRRPTTRTPSGMAPA